ncbi:class A sortase [Vagococcus fessus]|uniref:class A sortase n=1 Tax=Vagococcus fessus TaxID=120370 RepID=UPI0039EACCBA
MTKNNSQPRKKRLFIKLIISLLWIIGMCFLLWGNIRTVIFYNHISNKTYQYETTLPKSEQKVETIEAPKVQTVVKEKIQDSYSEALGRVRIPSVGIDTSILYDLTNYNLSVGSVMMFPERTPERDNMVILSHHYFLEDLLFGKLGNVKIGEVIYLDYLGYRYEYIVSAIDIVEETDTSSLENDKKTPHLTLITCDQPSYTDKRTIVTAKLKTKDYSELTQSKTGKKPSKSIQSNEQNTKQLSKKIKTNYYIIIFILGLILIGLCLIAIIL